MVGKACAGRLQKEYRAILKEPPPNVEAHPSANNILEWHYVITGPSESPYEGGVYHGKIVFPSEYPFKAPSIVMCTPSGRFAPNTKICMSMTDFHPELWQPLWSVGTILTGLLSFMLEDAPTTGSVTSTEAEKRQLAAQSLGFNVKNLQFRKLFPNWVEECDRRQSATQQEQARHGSGSISPTRANSNGHMQPAVQARERQLIAVRSLTVVGSVLAALAAILVFVYIRSGSTEHGHATY